MPPPPAVCTWTRLPSRPIANKLDIHIYDIARVEALAGPQGTLYGASSLSGTLRIITNKPDPTAFSAGYDLKADKLRHGNGGGSIEGFVNIPVERQDRDPPGGLLRLRGRLHQQRAVRPTHINAGHRYTDPSPTPAGCMPYPGVVPGTVCPLTVTNDAIARKRFNDVDSGGGRAALEIRSERQLDITPTVIAQTQKANGDFLVNTSHRRQSQHQ